MIGRQLALEGIGDQKIKKPPLSAAERKKIRDKKAQEGREEKRRYERLKEAVKEDEQRNINKIILFRSGGDWWKLGGNSALFYFYILAPKLKIEPRLVMDSDFHSRFKDGIISISDVKLFKKRMADLGVKIEREDDERIDFLLDSKVSEEMIKKLKKAEEEKKKAILNDLGKVKGMPELADAVGKLTNLTVNVVGHLDKTVYRLLGEDCLDQVRIINEELDRAERAQGAERGKFLMLIVSRCLMMKTYLKMLINMNKVSVKKVAEMSVLVLKIERLARAKLDDNR